jgi:hypothetical protein
MNTQLQFRVLYRQFLFRLMDVEMLSASARGDASGLLGQFGALLIFGSLGVAGAAVTVGQAIGEMGTGAIWQTERFLISLTMLIVGVFALLSWDSTFPDRRDVLVLTPLPIRGRTLFVAKVAAVGSALVLVVAAWNSLGAIAWPMILAPHGSGIVGRVRFVGAFLVTLVAAPTFLYCGVLGVQGCAAQLPRRWYLRASSVLQIAVFILFLSVLCFQPSANSVAELAAPEHQLAQAWLPTYWFMGLLNELSGAFPEGHAVMAPLAYRAVVGLAISILVAGTAFFLSYLRTLRKIVEEPDVVSSSRGGMWLPRFGSLPQTAVAQFVIRTLLRSRQHRAILALYLGGGLAISAIYWTGATQEMHLTGIDFMHRVNIPMLVSSVLMLAASWLGTRTVFSLPLDMRAIWLFRVTPSAGGADSVAAVRRALLALAVFPVVVVSAALLLWHWPWMPAVEHLLVLGLLGSALADLSLRGFRKIPFTCSYLPGKSKVHLIFWFGIIPVVIFIHQGALVERDAMASALRFGAVAATLAAVAVAARWVSNASAKESGPEIQFEESASDELILLGLNQ